MYNADISLSRKVNLVSALESKTCNRFVNSFPSTIPSAPALLHCSTERSVQKYSQCNNSYRVYVKLNNFIYIQ